MTTSIFIKTWIKDLQWLKHCVASIQRHASGFSECVIVADENCRGHMDFVPANFRVEYVPQWKNGYIQQQWIKITANKFTNADQILFTDSDGVFFTAFSPETFMRDGKPVLLKTKYTTLGDLVPWKAITEKFVGFQSDWEYMRRLPILFLSLTLSGFVEAYPDTEKKLRAMQDRSFSEFNVLGSFAEKNQHDEYVFQDTEEFLPEAVLKQYWSWGGVTAEIQKEIGRLP